MSTNVAILGAGRFAEAVVRILTAKGANVHVWARTEAGAERIAERLERLTGAPHGFRRRDSSSARREGIPADEGLLWGSPQADWYE